MLSEMDRRINQMVFSDRRYTGNMTAERMTEMINDLWEFRCPHCRIRMMWHGDNIHSITIQHNRNGTVQLLCRSCNSSHGQYPGDTFYSASLRYWMCHACGDMFRLTDISIQEIERKGYPIHCDECKRKLPQSKVNTMRREQAKRKHERLSVRREKFLEIDRQIKEIFNEYSIRVTRSDFEDCQFCSSPKWINNQCVSCGRG